MKKEEEKVIETKEDLFHVMIGFIVMALFGWLVLWLTWDWLAALWYWTVNLLTTIWNAAVDVLVVLLFVFLFLGVISFLMKPFIK